MGRFITTALRSALGGGTVPLIIVAVLLAAFSLVFTKGKEVERQAATVAKLERLLASQKASIARLQKQIAIADQVRRNAATRTLKDAALTANQEADANDFKTEIRRRPDLWIIDADDADRLSRIGR